MLDRERPQIVEIEIIPAGVDTAVELDERPTIHVDGHHCSGASGETAEGLCRTGNFDPPASPFPLALFDLGGVHTSVSRTGLSG